LLKTGDRVRIDMRRGEANMLVADKELAARRKALEKAGGYPTPESQSPWQEMQRLTVGQYETGAVLEPATKFQRLAQKYRVPRHSH
jgi:dihydroxy-acid dehydratase